MIIVDKKGYVVETERLILHRPNSEDLFVLKDLWRNHQCREFLGGIVSDETIEQKMIELQNHWDQHHFGLWAVRLKILNQIIGICGLHHSEDGIEISYVFFPQFWGKGYAVEAVKAGMNYGFSFLKLKEIIAITQDANAKSCLLLDRIGLIHINNFERYAAIQRRYRLTESEWQEYYRDRAS
jgi:ribosomal-protein-alanine N-acetyltransferase